MTFVDIYPCDGYKAPIRTCARPWKPLSSVDGVALSTNGVQHWIGFGNAHFLRAITPPNFSTSRFFTLQWMSTLFQNVDSGAGTDLGPIHFQGIRKYQSGETWVHLLRQPESAELLPQGLISVYHLYLRQIRCGRELARLKITWKERAQSHDRSGVRDSEYADIWKFHTRIWSSGAVFQQIKDKQRLAVNRIRLFSQSFSSSCQRQMTFPKLKCPTARGPHYLFSCRDCSWLPYSTKIDLKANTMLARAQGLGSETVNIDLPSIKILRRISSSAKSRSRGFAENSE